MGGLITMKKKLFTLFATVLLIFALSVTCFAKNSPEATVLPTEESSGNGNGGGQNKSSTSPKTGADLAGAFVVVITAAGIALISKKKYSEAN